VPVDPGSGVLEIVPLVSSNRKIFDESIRFLQMTKNFPTSPCFYPQKRILFPTWPFHVSP
jgi:hypothetical protein